MKLEFFVDSSRSSFARSLTSYFVVHFPSWGKLTCAMFWYALRISGLSENFWAFLFMEQADL